VRRWAARHIFKSRAVPATVTGERLPIVPLKPFWLWEGGLNVMTWKSGDLPIASLCCLARSSQRRAGEPVEVTSLKPVLDLSSADPGDVE
jgi:hypothetical protein